jgi:hypothetical protein
LNRLLQCNLGRSRRAQDLLFQTFGESEVALATVAEPYRDSDAPTWIGELEGLTAVTWTPTLGASGALLNRGRDYVADEWAGIEVVAVYVYVSSNKNRVRHLSGRGRRMRRKVLSPPGAGPREL